MQIQKNAPEVVAIEKAVIETKTVEEKTIEINLNDDVTLKSNEEKTKTATEPTQEKN